VKQIYESYLKVAQCLTKNIAKMTTKDLHFSLFYDVEKGIRNTTPRKVVNFEELVNIYKSERIQELTTQLQKAPKEDRQRIKLQLPFFTPYGTFSTRNNASIEHFNNRLIALDFDGLDRPNAEKLKRNFTRLTCTMLAAISPRGNGVKALVLCEDELTAKYNYQTLKLNKDGICANLTVYEYKESCDLAQFKLCQPMFIAYDSELYVNMNPTPRKLIYKEFTTEQSNGLVTERNTSTIKYTPYLKPRNTIRAQRIDWYLLKATETRCKEFRRTPEGERHHQIIKVQKIASWMHYAPHLEHEIKSALLDAVISMYGNEQNAELNNAQKSFAEAWNGARDSVNTQIETIINELKAVAI